MNRYESARRRRKAVGDVTDTTLIVLFIVALLVVGYLESRNAPIEQAVREEQQARFLMPIPCTATLSQRGAGEQFMTKCYISTTDKAKR